jgi:(1->4)-alpha-D-glucan 1-alpha-D-glucosylmutase
MAKGLEDTALYRYHRLIALNDVGGDPSQFGVPVEDFHAFCHATQARLPATLLATSTHDTKRSEDARMRLAVLSQLPREWAAAVERWSRAAERFKLGELPDRGFEYLFWQTLVCAWPLSAERAKQYLLKAVREAKLFTSWTRGNPAYEQAVAHFTDSVLGNDELAHQVGEFVARIAPAARAASLGLTLLKLLAPGVPDLYQGTELWDHSLADPDNRRPVDFELRRALLRQASIGSTSDVLSRSDVGLPKLYLIRRALELRRRREEAFDERGRYEPIGVQGPGSPHLVAFSRGGTVVAALRTRFFEPDAKWLDTRVTLPEGRFEHYLGAAREFSGTCSANELFEGFPVALLERRDPA